MTTTDLRVPAHGELDCADAEALLHETAAEAADLRARLDVAAQSHDDLLRQIDLLRVEGDRLRALYDEIAKAQSTLVDERDSLKDQVKILNAELVAAEADAVPEGTAVFGTVSREHVVAEYRRLSGINRGPIPPRVTAAVEAARNQIADDMTAAGNIATTAIIRREVRRRRRAQTRRTGARV